MRWTRMGQKRVCMAAGSHGLRFLFPDRLLQNGARIVLMPVSMLLRYIILRYINFFDEYSSFSYERLSDVPQYVRPGDFICLTDFKSGYHQLKMHADAC